MTIEKLKILFFGLNGRGGTLHYCSHLSSSMSKVADPYVLIPSYSQKNLFDKKVKLLNIFAPPNIFNTLLGTLNIFQHIKFLREAKEIDPDVIQVMDIHPWYVPYLLFLRKYPLVVLINDPELHSGEAGFVMSSILKFITRFLRKRADIVMIHGEKMKDVIEKQGVPRDKIYSSVIGEYSFFKRSEHAKKFDEVKNSLLLFGRIKGYKGVDTLIEAAEIIKEKIPDLHVFIAGEGDFSPYEKMIKDEDKSMFTVINEFVTKEKVDELFQKASIVVLPYKDATQSGLMSIGYAYKKPIIATNVGSIPEIVDDGKTGVLIPPNEPQALADAAIKLLEDPELMKKMGEAGHKKMKEEMDWDKIAERILERVYRRLVEKNKA
jgi:glycosyltransferase involved in cell wall biosynthesis